MTAQTPVAPAYGDPAVPDQSDSRASVASWTATSTGGPPPRRSRGVVLVLGPDIDEAGGAFGVTLGLLSMLALSLGTMGQRWVPSGVDPWWSATVQFTASIPPLAVLALLVDGTDAVSEPGKGLAALVYLAAVNSVIGLLLLGVLVRRGGAGASSSVFFLMPPVTAVLAFLVLGDTLDVRELLGLVIAVAGVAIATRRRTARRREPSLS